MTSTEPTHTFQRILRHASHLAMLLLLLLCWGCGEGQEKDGKVRLVLSVPADQKTRGMYRGMVEDFQKTHPNVEIQILEIPGNYYSKVLVMIAGRNAPDLMWMGQSFAEFASRGVFLDLTSRIKEGVSVEEFLPQALSWYCLDGRQYGVPFGIDMNYILYNRKLFDEAGVAYPTDDWTYDEFLEKAQALTIDLDGDGSPEQYGFRGGLEKASFGAAVISADGTKPLCNSPEMIRFLQTGLDLAEKWKVAPPPDDSDVESLDTYAYFQQEKAAMMTMFTWNLPFLRSKCADMNWDIVNMPTVERRGHWASSQAILVSKDTKHPDEAWELCKLFFGDGIQHIMAARGLPSNLRVAREHMATYTGNPRNWRALYKARDSLHPTPRIPNLSEIMSLYYSASSGVTAHRATPAEAMDKAEKAINFYLKRKRRNKRD
ncbi:MAG: sugar ABC transporter substrate-binding protein [Lentisphaeria bacterium]|nr:sugar ABC transporter substrate-binding protein [Lentisphaeria bacterium]